MDMIVIPHVLIALMSIALASIACFVPSKMLLRTSYGFVGATFVSGFYLVWSEPAHMIQACLSGIAYLTLVSVALAIARRRVVPANETVK